MTRLMVGMALAGTALAARLPVEGIAHVAWRVADLERASAFYEGALGFERAFTVAGGATFHKVSDEQFLELVSGRLPEQNLRLDHVAIQTRSLAAVRKALRLKSDTMEAPEGTRIEFVEYGERSAESRDRGAHLERKRLSGHLQHVGVIVARADLDASLRFYRDVLGGEEFWRYEPAPGDPRLIKLRLPGARRDVIELMIHGGGPLDRARIGSMHHVNFEVADIHAAWRFAAGRGLKAPLPRVNAEDIWSFNLTDADGSRVEAQDPTKIPPAQITEEMFHGRRAWVLSNGWMRVAVLAGGGHIAEVRLMTGDPRKDVNPMRVPHYPTIEPYRYDDARDNAMYGDTPHRWLSAGYMGHLLCFPIYGAPSEEEARAGLGNHGEAPIVEWRKVSSSADSDGVTLRYGADLEKTGFRVERLVRLVRGMRVVRVEEWVENLSRFDRPVNWMQHATFGPPFIEPGKTVLDASATRGLTAGGSHRSLAPDSALEWPGGTAWDGRPADLRVFQPRENSGTYYALRMDPARREQFFTLFHPDYRVLIGYTFPAEGNPWLADWQENKSSTVPPWNGQVVARGLEFGSSPFAEGLRRSVERGQLFGTPAYRWIGGRQKLKNEFTVFLEEIGSGFGGVADTRMENGVPVVTSR